MYLIILTNLHVHVDVDVYVCVQFVHETMSSDNYELPITKY